MAFTKITAAGIGSTETVTLDGLSVINNGSFGGNLTVGGVLTYEDVTNVDSVGLITARNGIVVGSGITLSKDGDIFATGITTVSGNVKVGTGITISPDGDVFATGVTTTGSLVSSGAVSGTTGTFTGDVDIADSIVHTGDNSKIRFPSNDVISFETSGSEGARLDAGRRFLIGSTTARTSGGGAYAHLQVEGTDSPGAEILVIRNSNDTYAPTLGLVKTRGTSDGAVTTVADNDKLGQIQFRGADGSDIYSVAASIHGEVDGSPSDGTDMPGALVFGTTADGSASPTERFRIDSSGRLLLGHTSVGSKSAAAPLQIQTASSGAFALNIRNRSSNDYGFITFTDNDADEDLVQIGIQRTAANTADLFFYTNGGNASSNERLRITSDGKLKIGTTATPTQSGALNVFGTDSATSQISIRRGSADDGAPKIHFQKSRNTTDGSHTVVQDDDVLGQIVFAGNDGAGPENGARISAEVDDTPGGNDMPARLVFSTTPNGSDTLVERFRITSGGNIAYRNQSVFQRKSGGSISLSSGVTHDIKISGNFEANDIIRVCWAINWNAGDGGAWGEAVIWKQYESTVRIRYVTDVKASPIASVSFPDSGNDIWLRMTTNAGINGFYMIDVQTHGCEPFPF